MQGIWETETSVLCTMKIIRARYVFLDQQGRRKTEGPGWPALEMLLRREDGLVEYSLVTMGDLNYLHYGFNLVFLGPEWEGRLPAIDFPAVPVLGLDPQVLHGFTADPEICRVARLYAANVHDDTFTGGPAEL